MVALVGSGADGTACNSQPQAFVRLAFALTGFDGWTGGTQAIGTAGFAAQQGIAQSTRPFAFAFFSEAGKAQDSALARSGIVATIRASVSRNLASRS